MLGAGTKGRAAVVLARCGPQPWTGWMAGGVPYGVVAKVGYKRDSRE